MDISNVMIGGASCGNASIARGEVDGTMTIECNAPRGAGRAMSVSIRTRGGRSSVPNELFSYLAPTVESVFPFQLLSGTIRYNLTVDG